MWTWVAVHNINFDWGISSWVASIPFNNFDVVLFVSSDFSFVSNHFSCSIFFSFTLMEKRDGRWVATTDYQWFCDFFSARLLLCGTRAQKEIESSESEIFWIKLTQDADDRLTILALRTFFFTFRVSIIVKKIPS